MKLLKTLVFSFEACSVSSRSPVAKAFSSSTLLDSTARHVHLDFFFGITPSSTTAGGEISKQIRKIRLCVCVGKSHTIQSDSCITTLVETLHHSSSRKHTSKNTAGKNTAELSYCIILRLCIVPRF